MRKAQVIFTRDFNLCINQIANDQYMYVYPLVWGMSLKTQIISYDGRASQWIRFPDEIKKLTAYMSKKPLDSHIFSEAAHIKFRSQVDALRKLISVDPKNIQDPMRHWQQILYYFTNEYNYNALGVYIPGLWKEPFLEFHKNRRARAEAVVARALKTREHAEGLLKELGDFMRKWLGPQLEARGYAASCLKLLTLGETQTFFESGLLPDRKTLDRRAKGFVYLNGHVYPTANIKQFLFNRGINLLEEKAAPGGTFRGTPAYAGKTVRGKVRIVMNTEEMKKFKAGEILVTSMTAPNYLPAMKKAKAIVTDEGGITCHAAIVSRELKKPCIISAKTATIQLRDGDMVEVDSKNGVIKKI